MSDTTPVQSTIDPAPSVKRFLGEIKRLRLVEARASDVLGALKSPGPTHPTTLILIQTLDDPLAGKIPRDP